MSTQQHSAKKLSPSGVKSKLILEAIGISHEILLALMVQELIPRELPRGGLDDRRIRKFNEGDVISTEELTRMLKISLDHYDLLEKRFLAYKVAFEKIENRIKKLHDLLQKSGAGGRHLNKTLRSIAELEIANYYSKKRKHLSSEKLSELVSKEIFRQDIKNYRLDWKKKWEKNIRTNHCHQDGTGLHIGNFLQMFTDHYQYEQQLTGWKKSKKPIRQIFSKNTFLPTR